MFRRFAQISIVFCILSASSICIAQTKIAVKFNAQSGQDDSVGKRLVTLIRQGISDSASLKAAGDAGSMLVCEFLSVKIKNRPSCAYSLIISSNTYGKQGPVLRHSLGICGNIKIVATAKKILENMENTADQFRQKLGETGENESQ